MCHELWDVQSTEERRGSCGMGICESGTISGPRVSSSYLVHSQLACQTLHYMVLLGFLAGGLDSSAVLC